MWFKYDFQEENPCLNYSLGKVFFEAMGYYARMVKRNFMDDLNAKLNWMDANPCLVVEHRHLMTVRYRRHRKRGQIGRNWEKDLHDLIVPTPKNTTESTESVPDMEASPFE